MKRILINGLALVAIISAAIWAAYSIGHQHGYTLGLVIAQKGCFVGTFDALKKLRAGDGAAGRQRIETLCFAAANSVYAGLPETEIVAKGFLQDFLDYRQTYRTNHAEWTPAETRLETLLASWKQP